MSSGYRAVLRIDMYRIWFERMLPSTYVSLLNGVAIVLGAATDTPDAPFAALGDAQAIIAGGRIYDASVMDLAPHLRVISRIGIGLNNVSIPDASAQGIAVCNAPDAPTISTVEHTISLILPWSSNSNGAMGPYSAVEKWIF